MNLELKGKERKVLQLKYLLLPPQGFGPEAKTRGGRIEVPA